MPISPNIGVNSQPLVGIVTSHYKPGFRAATFETIVASTTTIITSFDAGPYHDNVTVGGFTSLSATEDFLHPTGQWGPFDLDDGQL